MRTLEYLVAASLDGKICLPDGSFGPLTKHTDHVPDYLDRLKTFDAVLMGRKTYEVGLREGVTDPYPSMKSYVFSRTLADSPDARVRLVQDDPAAFVADLKSRPGGDIYLCGGGDLAGQLLAANLIDQISVKLNPVIIGEGVSLFERVKPAFDLELFDTKRYDSGVMLLSYRLVT